MNYVLSEKAAKWLRRQMAKDRGYKPATAAPSRLIRRDASGGGGNPAFHFKYSHSEEPPEVEGGDSTHTVSIGEGVVQIGGYTYFSQGGTVSNMDGGTRYVCAVVSLPGGSVTFYAYASTSALNSAQSDMSKYIFPLYKVIDYAVKIDYRPMPNAGCWEIAESVSNGGTGGSGTSGEGGSE